MKNKITLIIPDIHLRHEQAEKIIASVKADEIIFLGDYFDDFGDTKEMVSDTADWLVHSVNKPNRIHLFGNHDVHYAFPYPHFRCSGYDQFKYFIIDTFVKSNTWNKLKWFHVLDGTWLLTHAGLHNLLLPDSIKELHSDRNIFLSEIEKFLAESVLNGIRMKATGQYPQIFGAGKSRGGGQPVGGIIWCDYDAEFEPINGLNQIFGHTPQRNGVPRWHLTYKGESYKCDYKLFLPNKQRYNWVETSTNICLDVNRNIHYAIWNGSSLVVKDYNSL